MKHFFKAAAIAASAFTFGQAASAATVAEFGVEFEFAVGPPNIALGFGYYEGGVDVPLLTTLTPTTKLLWEFGLVGQSTIPGFTDVDFVGSVQSSAVDIFPTLVSALSGAGIDVGAVQAAAGLLLASAPVIIDEIINDGGLVLPATFGPYSGILDVDFFNFGGDIAGFSGEFDWIWEDIDPNANYDFNAGIGVAGLRISTLPTAPTPVPLPASLPLLGAGMLGLWALRRRT